MTLNVGTWERGLRIVIGVILLALVVIGPKNVVGPGGSHPPGHCPVGMVTRLVGVGVLNAQRVVMLMLVEVL